MVLHAGHFSNKKLRPLAEPVVGVSFLLFVHQMQVVEQLEEQAHNDCNNSCQNHALYAEGTKAQLSAGQTDNHDYRGHNQIGGLAVIYMAVNQNADTGGCNYAEEQDADTTHYRNGNAVNQLGQLATEGQDDGHNCCAANNPGAIYLGDSHNADVFAIGSVRSCTSKAGNYVGQTICKEGAGETRVLNKVAFNDIASNNQVTNMLS